ncbi:MAG: DUF523 domain-containing protein [Acidobacteriota bacterium]
MEPKIVISLCLLGIDCNYAGGNSLCEKAVELFKSGRGVPVCPEQLGGLPTPRIPAEIRGDRVINRDGEDVTAQFQKGAEEAAQLARLAGCTSALLKSKSPSCGVGRIYDGNFSGTLIDGDGLFAAELKKLGIEVETEEG